MIMIKKNGPYILIFFVLIFFQSIASGFENDFAKLFLKPRIYFDYFFDTAQSIDADFFVVSKYPIMSSSEFLKAVWSQERSMIGGQIDVESDFYTHAISSSKALGLMQIKYQTASDMHIENLFDPYDNLKGALEYHGYLRRLFNDEKKQIAAYHDGPGSIQRQGMSITGDQYYNQVKSSQKKYKSIMLESPSVFGVSISFENGTILKTHFYNSAAYMKFEFYNYSDIYINKKNDSFMLDYELNSSVLYFPRTVIAFGTGVTFEDSGFKNGDYILRLGFPWRSLIVKLGEENSFTFKEEYKEFFYCLKLKNSSAIVAAGMKFNDFKVSVTFDLLKKSFGSYISIF